MRLRLTGTESSQDQDEGCTKQCPSQTTQSVKRAFFKQRAGVIGCKHGAGNNFHVNNQLAFCWLQGEGALETFLQRVCDKAGGLRSRETGWSDGLEQEAMKLSVFFFGFLASFFCNDREDRRSPHFFRPAPG
ncbi:MAG TPA: hypothetical protein VNU49_07515 [Opitutaceae bacterium]|nr:hypothetical protein [Opitutaceae bacterium]